MQYDRLYVSVSVICDVSGQILLHVMGMTHVTKLNV